MIDVKRRMVLNFFRTDMALPFILMGTGVGILYMMKRRAASGKRLGFFFLLSNPMLFWDRRRSK